MPDWIERLQGDGPADALELTWLEPAEQRSLREQWLAIWDQVPYGEEFHAKCKARIERSIPLAVGPRRYRRLSMTENSLVLLHDPQRPEIPWVSLSIALPSALWIPGATTPDALLERLAPYLGTQRPSITALPRTLRVFKPMNVEDRSVVVRAMDALELWMDDATWENGHDDDPWIDVEPNPGMLRLQVLRDQAQQESPGRFPSTGFRSLWSHSILLIEQVPFGGWIFELHYTPVDDPQLLEDLEADLGIELPARDLPVDLAASLLREASMRPDLVDELCETEAEAALAKVSIEPAEPTSFALLEGWLERSAGDEGMLAQLAELVSGHRFDALLFELALRCPADSPLRADLESFLRPEATGGEA